MLFHSDRGIHVEEWWKKREWRGMVEKLPSFSREGVENKSLSHKGFGEISTKILLTTNATKNK